MTGAIPNKENGVDGVYGSVSLVWDRGVRAFHWLLVLSVAGALLTGLFGDAKIIDAHVILGAAIATLITFRVIWGFWGTTYARFGSFVPSPLAIFRHARELWRGDAPYYTGHNPVGSAMIFVLLALLTVIIITGIIVLGGVIKEGPLAPFTTFAVGAQAKEVHEFLAYLLIVLIALHVLGILLESARTQENLVRSMVTGRKLARSDAAQPIRSHQVSAFTVFAALSTFAAGVITHFSFQPALGVPDQPLTPLYVKECGSCHSPHHPSIAPATTWIAIMGSLDQHFGENASLASATTADLTAYVTANSAEKWDTWPANSFRMVSATAPLRITETRGWKRTHRHLPERLFKSQTVGGKLNCSKCHRDAETGRFAPRAIAIPKETVRQ
jgi:cytochrome b